MKVEADSLMLAFPDAPAASAAETLPAPLRRRLAPYGQVAFAGHPMPVQRLRPRR